MQRGSCTAQTRKYHCVGRVKRNVVVLASRAMASHSSYGSQWNGQRQTCAYASAARSPGGKVARRLGGDGRGTSDVAKVTGGGDRGSKARIVRGRDECNHFAPRGGIVKLNTRVDVQSAVDDVAGSICQALPRPRPGHSPYNERLTSPRTSAWSRETALPRPRPRGDDTHRATARGRAPSISVPAELNTTTAPDTCRAALYGVGAGWPARGS